MEFATRSPGMQQLLEQAGRLARSEAPVLIQGESGTGKERLALYIHRHSARANGPFIKVDCTTIPEALWESELFGYARGAFAGANREGKMGRFDLAHGGTLFLDEVAVLPVPVQAKLLLALRDQATWPVGAAEPLPVDVRVVATTSRDLGLLQARGLFRGDLHSFLSTARVTMPPLRERKDDIELLVQEVRARETAPGSNPPRLTAEAVGALLLYRWPGNIRELENALKRAMLLAGPNQPIDLRHLPPEVTGSLESGTEGGAIFKRYIKSAELQLLRWALAECRDDRTKAARFLGLSRAALYKKLKLYPEFRSDLHGEEGADWDGDEEEEGGVPPGGMVREAPSGYVVRETPWTAPALPAVPGAPPPGAGAPDRLEQLERSIDRLSDRFRSLERLLESVLSLAASASDYGLKLCGRDSIRDHAGGLAVVFSGAEADMARLLARRGCSLVLVAEGVEWVIGVVRATGDLEENPGGSGTVGVVTTWVAEPRPGLRFTDLGLGAFGPDEARTFRFLTAEEFGRARSVVESRRRGG